MSAIAKRAMRRRSAVPMDQNAKIFHKADEYNDSRTSESQEEHDFKRMYAEC